MLHRILTCKNHPELRWSCKDIAWRDDYGYNGCRNIFFNGTSSGKGMYSDNSGLETTHFKDGERVIECKCPFKDLILAPEDVLVKRPPSKETKAMKNAIVLLSGGIDSAVTLAIAKKNGYNCFTLIIDYPQQPNIEIEKAIVIATAMKCKYCVIQIPLSDNSLNMDKNRYTNEIPFRNLIFLSHAANMAADHAVTDIYIGANANDYADYPDCRSEFFKLFEQLCSKRITLHLPLLQLQKPAILILGKSLGVDFSKTISCYYPDTIGRSCGKCHSCKERQEAFVFTGLTDTIEYVTCKEEQINVEHTK